MFLADQYFYILINLFGIQFSRYSRRTVVLILPAVSAIRDRELSLLPSHRSYSNVFINKSGSHLLFHTVSSIVPSAVQVLTVVFGMSTSVAPARIATGQTYYLHT